MKARFIVIGYGWRADFYYRIAKLLPDRFRICAGVLRTPERAEQVAEKEGVFATSDLAEALAQKPDFAVLCVPKAATKEYLTRLMEMGIPVLCETPPGRDVEELRELWKDAQRLRGRVQVAEQYFLQPYYAGVLEIIRGGWLGEVSSAMLSAVHGYHAVSLFRKILGVGHESCTIVGQKFTQAVTATNGRNGFDRSGRIVQEERRWASLQFESGKTAFLDFSGEQYFSLIRARRWNVRGVRGEIDDMTVRCLTEENLPVEQTIRRIDVGINNISEWSHKGMMFLDRQIYENPFYPARMNDDEIAMASCLRAMKEYAAAGKEFYSLREALQDAYLAFELERAIESGETVRTETPPWVL